jgi:hypothetical protein
MGEEKGGYIFVHKGLVLGKLYIGPGLGDGSALLKGRFERSAIRAPVRELFPMNSIFSPGISGKSLIEMALDGTEPYHHSRGHSLCLSTERCPHWGR